MTSDDGIEARIDALYQAEHRDFVARRNVLADQLRAENQPAEAQRVRALPKPSVSAWAVNQLWWRHRDTFDRLHRAGAELIALQQRGVATAGQTANEDRRRAIAELVEQARAVLDCAGHTSSMATLRKVTISLEASAAWGGSLRGPGPGRLHTELAPPGFGDVLRLGPPPAIESAESAMRSDARARARSRLTQAQLDHDRATRELDDARTVLASAEAARRNAEAALARAQQTLSETRAIETDAQTRHETASKTAASARTMLDEARAALYEERPADAPPGASTIE